MSTPLIEVSQQETVNREPPSKVPFSVTRQEWHLTLSLYACLAQVYHYINWISTFVVIMAVVVLILHPHPVDRTNHPAEATTFGYLFIRIVHGPVYSAITNRTLLAAHAQLLVDVAHDADGEKGERLADVCVRIDDWTLVWETSCRVETVVACFWDMTRVTGALRHALDSNLSVDDSFSHPCIDVGQIDCAVSRLSPPDRPCHLFLQILPLDGAIELINKAMRMSRNFTNYSDTHWETHKMTSDDCRALLPMMARVLRDYTADDTALGRALSPTIARLTIQSNISTVLHDGCTAAGRHSPLPSIIHTNSSFVSTVYVENTADGLRWMRRIVEKFDQSPFVEVYSSANWTVDRLGGMRVGNLAIGVYFVLSTAIFALFVDMAPSSIVVHAVSMGSALLVIYAVTRLIMHTYAPLFVLMYPFARISQKSSLTAAALMLGTPLRHSLIVMLIVTFVFSLVEWRLFVEFSIITVMAIVAHPCLLLGVNHRRPPIRAVDPDYQGEYLGYCIITVTLLIISAVTWLLMVLIVAYHALTMPPSRAAAEATVRSARYTGTPIEVANCTDRLMNETGVVSTLDLSDSDNHVIDYRLDDCGSSCVDTYETFRVNAVDAGCMIQTMYDTLLMTNVTVPFLHQLCGLLIVLVVASVAFRIMTNSTMVTTFMTISCMGEGLLTLSLVYVFGYPVVQVDDAMVAVFLPILFNSEHFGCLLGRPASIRPRPFIDLLPVVGRQFVHLLLIFVPLTVDVVIEGTVGTAYMCFMTSVFCHFLTILLILPFFATHTPRLITWIRCSNYCRDLKSE